MHIKIPCYFLSYVVELVHKIRKEGVGLKNNYNFGVVKLHLKFNQRTDSTPHKFQTCFPSQNLILFQPDLSLRKE